MFFFFSSRRRHTRFKCDWSSDVCSSDLLPFRSAESNDQAERNGSPASYYKSTRQLQRKSTRYLHTQYLKGQRFTYESGRGWSRSLRATIEPPRAAPTFLSKNMPSELENARKSNHRLFRE